VSAVAAAVVVVDVAVVFFDLRLRSKNLEPLPLLAALVSLSDCCCKNTEENQIKIQAQRQI